MRCQELIREVEAGKVSPVYLFSGEENYLKEDALRRIKETLIKPEFSQFNYDLLSGKEISGTELLNKLLTLPAGGGRRLILIRDAQKLNPSVKEKIIEYLESPSQTSCLILWAPKVDLRKKFYATIEKQGESIAFYPLRDRELSLWVRDYLSRRKGKISAQALDLLIKRVGNNLGEMAGELEKLLIHIEKRREINLKDVESLVGAVKTYTIFALTDAIGKKREKEALGILSRMMDEGTPATEILYMIVRQFRFLLRTQNLLEKKFSENKIIQALAVRPFVVKNLIIQAKNFSLEKLIESFEDLLQAEIEIKSSIKTPRMILELLILKLCNS
ncbi:MAG: DNA polymerase III subunit delta [Firmicutes bacterium]|nr:DNA polymerase III subunit delta [Bacillota bacterium]